MKSKNNSLQTESSENSTEQIGETLLVGCLLELETARLLVGKIRDKTDDAEIKMWAGDVQIRLGNLIIAARAESTRLLEWARIE